MLVDNLTVFILPHYYPTLYHLCRHRSVNRSYSCSELFSGLPVTSLQNTPCSVLYLCFHPFSVNSMSAFFSYLQPPCNPHFPELSWFQIVSSKLDHVSNFVLVFALKIIEQDYKIEVPLSYPSHSNNSLAAIHGQRCPCWSFGIQVRSCKTSVEPKTEAGHFGKVCPPPVAGSKTILS